MNIYDRALMRITKDLGIMSDEHTIVLHELRDTVEENKRLRHMLYANDAQATEPRSFFEQLKAIHSLPEMPAWQRHMDGGQIDRALSAADAAVLAVRARTKIEQYFDVTRWLWVTEAVVPYRVIE